MKREQELIEGARADPHAFAPLYEAYVDRVWRYALARLGDPERAADVTSTTFANALKALPTFEVQLRGDKTSFQAWLMTIAYNAVMTEMRQHRPVASLQDSGVQPWLADNRPSPEDQVIANDERRRIQSALHQLSGTQRRIVELRLAGFRTKEIAEVLRMSVSAVDTAHFRAYARLRDVLTNADDGQGTAQ